MFRKMVKKVYNNGKLVNTIESENELEILQSFADDCIANKFMKNNSFKQAGYNEKGVMDYKVIYKSTIGNENYLTEITYIGN